MLDFFRGWKRKLGCVTLLLACVLAAGWVRSRIYFDNLDITISLTTTKITFDFQSLKSRIGCNLHIYRTGDQTASLLEINRQAYDLRIETFAGSDRIQVHFDRAGFRYGTVTETIHPDTQLVYDTIVLQSPYWSIVIPLTLLSAWLLLSRPRAGRASGPNAK